MAYDISLQSTTRAFTLVEVLAVIAIMGIISTLTYQGFLAYGQRQQFQQFSNEIALSMAETKQRAVAAQDGTAWGVYVSATTIEFFSGTTVAPGDSENTIIAVPSYVTASSDFYTGDAYLVFAERTGVPSATGTIVLVDTRTVSTSTITIEAGGLVK